MLKRRGRALYAGLVATLALAIGGAVVTVPATPAWADPSCQNVLLIFARGSGAALQPWSAEASAFFTSVDSALGISPVTSNVVQLGDEDGDGTVENGEYPAVIGLQWVAFPGYWNSVQVGVQELIAYLNQRVINCPNEVEVLGGYSQGADVIGSALATGTGGFSATAKNHIGYVAYYGDPTYNNGGFLTCYNPALIGPIPWARGDATCNAFNVPLAQRAPYVPSGFEHRTGSWCDKNDGLCSHNLSSVPGSHPTVYAQYWIAQSAPEIAAAALAGRQQLLAGQPITGPTNPAGKEGGSPTYDGTIRISGTNGVGANLRSAPNTSSSVIGNLAEGTVVHPDCYTNGQNVGGTTLWWKVNGGYYTSFYDTVPIGWQTAIEQHYGIQSCAAIADSDGDGTPNASDACPQVYVAGNGGCPGKGDFSLDGKSDVTAFYNYDGGMTNVWMWNGQSNLYTSGPYAPWSQSTGFDAWRLSPAGTADFNGDKMKDMAAFYAYDNGAMGLDIWYGNTQGGVGPYQAWYVGSGWLQDHLITAGVGDFNGDGRADVAAFYRYDNMSVNLYVWYGQADLSMVGPYTVWTGSGWDGTRIITVGVGDTDGDGKADISTFYRHDNGMMDQNVWYGNGAGSFTLGRPWHVDTGWDGTRFIPMGVVDVNGDGRADTIAIFRHDNNLVDMRVWYGTSSRVGATDPGGPWTGSGWDGSRIIPAGTGDYNGDGKADIAAFYRYDGQVVGLDIWYGDGAGGMSPFGAWYNSTDGWEGARLIPPAKG